MATLRAPRRVATTSPTSLFSASAARCTRRSPAAVVSALSATKLGPSTIQARYKSGPYGYTQAKGLVFNKFGEPSDVLKLHTHSISPTLPSRSVLVRALTAPINPADVNTIQGTYGVKPKFNPLLGTTEPAVIPGNEGVFEVVSAPTTSHDATQNQLQKGDWVIPAKTGFGTWRTHAEAPSTSFLKINKDGLSPAQAGTVAVNPCSAYRMLRDYVTEPGPLREGDWFLQNGANSGVGRAAIQLARVWGYNSINVVRSRPTAEETQALKDELTALGATKVVTEEEFQSREFRDQLASWTAGSATSGGIKLGLNCVGGKSAQTMSKMLGQGGTLVTYGGMARQPVALPTGLLIFKDIRFRGFWLSRWADADTAAKHRTVNEILDLVREGKFSDVPTVEVPWNWETEEQKLSEAVQGTLEGFRSGKGMFVFGET